MCLDPHTNKTLEGKKPQIKGEKMEYTEHLEDNFMEAKSNQAKPREHVMQMWKKNVNYLEQIEQCGWGKLK